MRTKRRHRQHQGYPSGTNSSEWRRERRNAAKQGMVWGNEKAQWSGAGGKDHLGRADTTTGRIERRREQGVGAIAPICWMRGGAWSTQGGSRLAGILYSPVGREEPQQEWSLSQRVRRKNVVVREVEHVRNEAAGSSLTVARFVASAPEIGLCALCPHGSVGSIVGGGWYVSCCNSSSTCSARSGVIAVISTSCS